MGVHCYSINDGLKIILDNCCNKAEGKFFGIACAAGGTKSYLASMHLTQICMNEWRMIQLPRIVYATTKDFKENEISRLTIQTLVSDSLMRQILRQLNKLIDVIAVSNEETTYLKGVLLDENLL